MLSDGKANHTGEEDYPNTRILDTYSLEFLDLPNNYSEKDLKKSIISNMKDFILEIMVSQYTLKLIDKKLLEEKLKEIKDIVEGNNKNE